MRKLLVSLLTLLVIVGHAQIYQPALLYGEYKNRVGVNFLLGIPQDTLLPPAYAQNMPHIAALHDSLYLWSGVLHYWVPAGSAGGSSANFYTTNGTLTGDRSVSGNLHNLTFSNIATLQMFSNVFGGFSTSYIGDLSHITMKASAFAQTAVVNVNNSGGSPLVNITADDGGANHSQWVFRSDSILWNITSGKMNISNLRTDWNPDTSVLRLMVWNKLTKGWFALPYGAAPGSGGGGGAGAAFDIGNDLTYDSILYFPTWNTNAIIGKSVRWLNGSSKLSLSKVITDSTISWTVDVAEANLSLGNIGGTLPLAKIAQGGAGTNDVLTWNGSVWAPAAASGGSSLSGLTGSGIVYATSSTTVTSEADFKYDPSSNTMQMDDGTIKLKDNSTSSEVTMFCSNYGLHIGGNFFGTTAQFRLFPAGSEIFFDNTAIGDLVFRPAQVEKMRLFSTGKFRLAAMATGGTAPATSGSTRIIICDANGDFSFSIDPNNVPLLSASVNTFTGDIAVGNILSAQNLLLGGEAATDADKIILKYYTKLPTVSANRTVTLPSGTGNTGKVFVINNTNSSGTFHWSFNTTVLDGSGGSVTTLTNQKVYQIYYDGSNFQIIN
jgi:hypothetical protein